MPVPRPGAPAAPRGRAAPFAGAAPPPPPVEQARPAVTTPPPPIDPAVAVPALAGRARVAVHPRPGRPARDGSGIGSVPL